MYSSSGLSGWGLGSPTPVKTSQKQDGCRAASQVSRVIGIPLGQIPGPATVFIQYFQTEEQDAIRISNSVYL